MFDSKGQFEEIELVKCMLVNGTPSDINIHCTQTILKSAES